MGTPIILADRVLIAITTTGTGTYSLGSAVTGYLTPALAGVASGARVAYVVVDSLTAPTAFEIGEGLYTAGAPATLTRTQIRRNTTGGTSAINWGAGTKYLMLTPGAANLPTLDTDGALVTPSLTLTGVLAIAAGTQAAPSLTPNGDANTGLWAPAADTLAISTNAVERLRVADAAVTLTVPGLLDDSTSVAAPVLAFSDDTNTGIAHPGADVLALATGGAERLRVDASGNLGLGTTAPARPAPLTAMTATTNAVTPILRLDSQCSGTPANGIGTGIEFAVETTVNNTEIGATIEAVVTDVTAGSEDIDLVIKTMAAGANAVERLRVSSTGSVGIGVTPAYKLHVSGDIYATGNVTAFSDLALKDQVETIADALDLVLRMRGVPYVRRDTGEPGVGVIAQEMQRVLPAVVADRGGHLGVAYGNLTGVLIEAVKALAARITTLEAAR